MAIIHVETLIKAHDEVVWRVMSDVEAFAEVAPQLSKVETIEGARETLRRRCYDHQGNSWVEFCTWWEEGVGYTMEVDTNNFIYPFEMMRRTWSLEARDDGTLIKMHYEYTPKFGVFGSIINRVYYRRILRRYIDGLMDNWADRIRDREWAYKVNVDTILHTKGKNIVSVPPSAPIAEAAALLREKRIGCVLVIDAKGDLAGLVSERDIVWGIAKYGETGLEHPVSDVMTRKLIVCHPENDMLFVMACMTDKRIRHLPVMDGDELKGIISIGDVVKQRIFMLESESETMRSYIAGREWRYHHLGTGVHDVSTLRGELGQVDG